MTTASLITIVFFGSLMVLSVWGFRWHWQMLRLLANRRARAVKDGDLHLLPLAAGNTLRYRYRIIEAVAVMVSNVLGIVITLMSTPAPAPPSESALLTILTIVYIWTLLPVLASLVGFSGFLSYLDVRLYRGQSIRMRDLPWLHPSKFF